MTAPTGSILCRVYNHEPFLQQTLERFVMQKTSFPIDGVVLDALSTAGCTAIIREFVEKSQDIINLIYTEKNQYRKGTLMITRYNAMQGKCVAWCEGDDYWTNQNKLQKQVDSLQTHPEYSMRFHRIEEQIEGKQNMDKGLCKTYNGLLLLQL